MAAAVFLCLAYFTEHHVPHGLVSHTCLGLASLWWVCSRGVGFPEHLGPLVLTLLGMCVCMCVCYSLQSWGLGPCPPGLGTDTKGMFGVGVCWTQPAALPGDPRAWGVDDLGRGVPEPYRNFLMFFSDTRTKSTMG